MMVLDVVAKGFKIDFAAGELHFRRAPEPPGVVDDSENPKRSGGAFAQRPDAKSVQGCHRPSQQGGRPVVRPVWLLAHQHRVDATFRQRDSGGQSGRPAADYDRFKTFVMVVRHQNCPGYGNCTSTRRGGTETTPKS